MIDKISEITYQNIADYLRIDSVDEQIENELNTYLNISKTYISNYIGIPISSSNDDVKTLDDYPDLVIVVYILCQDMYDNRSMYNDGKTINRTVESILRMHTLNNL